MQTVVIVGVGALGSHVVQFLRATGASIRMIDFDRVEQKNTLSQFHGKPSVGKGKADGLRATMSFLFGLKVEAIPHKLTVDNAETLLRGDLVIDCLDNGASRKIVQDTVRKLNIPCLHGALAADGGFGRVVWDARFVIDYEDGTGAPTCEGGEHLPFIGITAAYLSRAAQEFLLSGRQLGYEINPVGGAIVYDLPGTRS